MIAKQLISQEIPELTMSDSVVNALNLMDEFRLSHLPVVENRMFMGMVSEEELEVLEQPAKGLLHHSYELMEFCVHPGQHIFDVLKLFTENHLTIVPVVSKDGIYEGSVTISDLTDNIAFTLSSNFPGGIIVLELNVNDYSLQEIAGIVESNNTKILSTSLTTFPNTTKVEVTIKVNTEHITPILQTFNRYDYLVKASYQERNNNEDMKLRYEEFMKYLNM